MGNKVCDRTVLSLLVLIMAACATGRSGSAAERSARTVPLKPYAGRLRTVDVTLGGRTYPFLFDTGGGLVILTPSVARELGCVPFGRLVGFRNNGEQLATSRCAEASLAIGSSRAVVSDPAWFDLMALLGGLPEVSGVAGLPAFGSNAITIDLGGNRIVTETPESLARRVRSAKEIRVRPSRQSGGASLDLFVSVDTPRGPIWLELDSGNEGPVLLSPAALEQLGVEIAADASRDVTLQVTGFGPVTAEATRRDIIYDGLLNARFMERFVVTLDLAHMRAWMAPRPAS